jgi:transposase InsO family protein
MGAVDTAAVGGRGIGSRFRDESLEREAFANETGARRQGAWFRREYNTVRPQSALEYQTLREFSNACGRGLHGQPIETDN